ncbi:hypothetical protein [Kribbella sp. NPDC055071]
MDLARLTTAVLAVPTRQPTTAVTTVAALATLPTAAVLVMLELALQLTTAVATVAVMVLRLMTAMLVELVLQVTAGVLVMVELALSGVVMAALSVGVVVLVGGVRVRGLLTLGVMRTTPCLMMRRRHVRGRAESGELPVRRIRGVIWPSHRRRDPRLPHVPPSVSRKHKRSPRTHLNRPHPN